MQLIALGHEFGDTLRVTLPEHTAVAVRVLQPKPLRGLTPLGLTDPRFALRYVIELMLSYSPQCRLALLVKGLSVLLTLVLDEAKPVATSLPSSRPARTSV